MKILTIVRKPLSESSVAENIKKHKTGAINIDACRIGTEQILINTFDEGAKPFGGGAGCVYSTRTSNGRWPSNLVHNGSKEVLDLFPFTTSTGKRIGEITNTSARSWKNNSIQGVARTDYEDEGSASRFFYKVKKWNHDGKKD